MGRRAEDGDDIRKEDIKNVRNRHGAGTVGDNSGVRVVPIGDNYGMI